MTISVREWPTGCRAVSRTVSLGMQTPYPLFFYTDRWQSYAFAWLHRPTLTTLGGYMRLEVFGLPNLNCGFRYMDPLRI